jgi:hypothetical protein
MLDVQVTGKLGFYTFNYLTKKAQRQVGRRTTYIDDGRECRRVVAELVRVGLRVEVNGVDMTGFGQ